MKLTEQGSTLFLENKKESQYIVMGTMFFVGVLMFIFLRQEPNLGLFSIGLSLLGIIGFLGIKREYVTVSPSTHLIQTVKKSIISSHQQMVQFSEVQSVLVEEAKGGAKGNKFYYPLLILNFHDGRSISLTKGARSSAFLVDHLFKKRRRDR